MLSVLMLAATGCGDRDGTSHEKALEDLATIRTAPVSAAPVVPAASPTPDAMAAEAQAQSSTEKPIEVTPAQYFSAYASNEIAADQHYNGHLIAITGVLSRIFAVEGVAWIEFKVDRWGLNTVDAAYGGKPADVAHLTSGDKVKLICIGKGKALDSPALVLCSLEKAWRWTGAH